MMRTWGQLSTDNCRFSTLIHVMSFSFKDGTAKTPPLSISPSTDPNESRLTGGKPGSFTQWVKAPSKWPDQSAKICKPGKGSLMKLDISLLALWVLSAVCGKWQLAGDIRILHWYWILVDLLLEGHCDYVYTENKDLSLTNNSQQHYIILSWQVLGFRI